MPPDRRRSGSRRSPGDRKSTRLNSSHLVISYAVFCLKKKKRRRATLSAPKQNRYSLTITTADITEWLAHSPAAVRDLLVDDGVRPAAGGLRGLAPGL